MIKLITPVIHQTFGHSYLLECDPPIRQGDIVSLAIDNGPRIETEAGIRYWLAKRIGESTFVTPVVDGVASRYDDDASVARAFYAECAGFFGGEEMPELPSFEQDYLPCWHYRFGSGVLTRRMGEEDMGTPIGFMVRRGEDLWQAHRLDHAALHRYSDESSRWGSWGVDVAPSYARGTDLWKELPVEQAFDREGCFTDWPEYTTPRLLPTALTPGASPTPARNPEFLGWFVHPSVEMPVGRIKLAEDTEIVVDFTGSWCPVPYVEFCPGRWSTNAFPTTRGLAPARVGVVQHPTLGAVLMSLISGDRYMARKEADGWSLYITWRNPRRIRRGESWEQLYAGTGINLPKDEPDLSAAPLVPDALMVVLPPSLRELLGATLHGLYLAGSTMWRPAFRAKFNAIVPPELSGTELESWIRDKAVVVTPTIAAAAVQDAEDFEFEVGFSQRGTRTQHVSVSGSTTTDQTLSASDIQELWEEADGDFDDFVVAVEAALIEITNDDPPSVDMEEDGGNTDCGDTDYVDSDVEVNRSRLSRSLRTYMESLGVTL